MDTLVPYDSSDSSDKEHADTSKNTRLRLPSAINKLGTKAQSKDDAESHSNPALHNNRIRSFKHERGNWATYVYVPVDESVLNDIPELCQRELEDVVDLQLCAEFHLTLSRTIVLQYHQIDGFVKSLEKLLSTELSFHVSLGQLEVYVNDDKTRTFLGLKAESTSLSNVLQKVDSVMIAFKQPEFYKDPSFHISFAWCLGNKLDLLTGVHLERLKTCLATYVLKNSDLSGISVNELRCKIGHKVYVFKLNKFI